MTHFHPGPSRCARFRLAADASPLFPYLNAVLDHALYREKPECVQFPFEGAFCTLYPEEAVAAPFAGLQEAAAFVGRLLRFLNDLHRRRSSLRPVYRRFRPLPVFDLYKLLPQSNCRRCGLQSCLAFAAALSRGGASPGQCPDFAAPLYCQAVYPVRDRQNRLVSTLAIDLGHDQPPPERGPAETPAGLTRRETQVLRLLAGGATNVEIAEELAISPNTIKIHVTHIFDKLGVGDRTRAAVWAARHHLL
ncbi:MAG: LuxR C-terminal-related transcriptional regulator [Desulfobacteraceae bacterium]|nr:LuxR C-terminal-related transcriptional regulator [Desulfobacteraceae bacterium]